MGLPFRAAFYESLRSGSGRVITQRTDRIRRSCPWGGHTCAFGTCRSAALEDPFPNIEQLIETFNDFTGATYGVVRYRTCDDIRAVVSRQEKLSRAEPTCSEPSVRVTRLFLGKVHGSRGTYGVMPPSLFRLDTSRPFNPGQHFEFQNEIISPKSSWFFPIHMARNYCSLSSW